MALSGVLSNSYSSPRCIDGSGLNQFGLLVMGSYPWVTSGSAVPFTPRWPLPPKAIPHWPLPPMASSAPIVPPLAFWSLTGIGVTLLLLAGYTILEVWLGDFNVCIIVLYMIYVLYCIIYLLSPCNGPAAMPLPYLDALRHYCIRTSGSRM